MTDNEGEDSRAVTITAVAMPGLVTAVSILEGDRDLFVGNEVALSAEVQTAGVVDGTVNWTSSDDMVATVTSSGSVTARSEGTAMITATSAADATKFDSVSVTVLPTPLGTARDETITDMAVDSEGNIYLVGMSGERPRVDGALPVGSDVLLLKLDPQGRLLWRQTWGTPQGDGAYAIAIDPSDGSLVLVGETGGNMLTGTAENSFDAFVMKVTPERDTVWIKQLGSCGFDGARDVAIDADGNVFVTGYFNSLNDSGCGSYRGQALAAGFSAAGHLLWYELHGTGSAYRAGGVSLALTSDEKSVMITGDHLSAFESVFNDQQASFLLTLDTADGTREQLHKAGFGFYDLAKQLLVDDEDDILWIGTDYAGAIGSSRTTTIRRFSATDPGTASASIQFLGERHLPGPAVLDNDGNLVFALHMLSDSHHVSAIDVLKLDAVTLEIISRTNHELDLAAADQQITIGGADLLPDGTVVFAGYTNSEHFEQNQGHRDPFLWFPFGR